MALGAIEAIEEYGLKPGMDIKIVSVDAVRGAFEAMIAGKLNVTVECNPLLGATVLRDRAEAGEWRAGRKMGQVERRYLPSGYCTGGSS